MPMPWLKSLPGKPSSARDSKHLNLCRSSRVRRALRAPPASELEFIEEGEQVDQDKNSMWKHGCPRPSTSAVAWPGGDARRSTDKVGLVRFLLFALASTRFPFSLI